jgi:hypothetical protein
LIHTASFSIRHWAFMRWTTVPSWRCR